MHASPALFLSIRQAKSTNGVFDNVVSATDGLLIKMKAHPTSSLLHWGTIRMTKQQFTHENNDEPVLDLVLE